MNYIIFDSARTCADAYNGHNLRPATTNLDSDSTRKIVIGTNFFTIKPPFQSNCI